MPKYPTDTYRVTYHDGRTEDVELRESYVIDAPGLIRSFTGVDGDNRGYKHPAPEQIASIRELATGVVYPRT